MSGVRFVEAELDYGCHIGGRAFRFPQKTAPVVIAGPNGAGKSTLLDALVRTLYGFNRRLDEDKLRLDARRPWSGDACRARVVIADADGALWQIERRFGDAEVELRPLDAGADMAGRAWRGDGNPGATNAEAREYRRRLEARVGLAERAAYEATACVRQGDLSRTRLDDELLRIAAGGHAHVDEALERVKEAYRERTKRSIDESDRGATKARELERVEVEIAEVRQALQAASAAERRRRPLLEEQEAATARIAVLDAEIRQLEAAQRPLAERGRLEAVGSAQRERLRALLRRREELDDVRRDHAAASRARESLGARLYPADFPERLSELRLRWEQRQELAAEKARADEAAAAAGAARWTGPAAAASVAGAVAGAALIVARRAAGLALLVLGLAGGFGVLWLRNRARRELERWRRERDELAERLEQLDARIAERLAGVPHAETLSAATAAERRERYEREREVLEQLERAKERLADAAADARGVLDDEASGPDRPANDEHSDPDALLAAVDRAIESARGAAARAGVALDGAGDGLELPDGVSADAGAVDDALRERRAERRRLTERVQRLHRELVEAAGGHASPVALRDELDALERRRAELEHDAAAYAEAYTLLRDAYEAFRARDQDRLLDHVSTHLSELTRDALGPLEARGALTDARVHAFGQPVVLSSPPLSYGELHATMFAIRLGATDFLARSGIRPPLLVDEPFAHLDDARSEGVWRLLCGIARARQVILTTQDTATLARLGAEIDIALTRPLAADGRRRAPHAAAPGD